MIPIPVFRFVAGALVDANDAAWRVLGFALDGSRDALATALDPDRLLPALFASRSFRRLMFRTVSQVAINYRGSSLSEGRAGRIRGGDRLPWVPACDNFAPLTSLDWQVHVYGAAAPGMADVCGRRGLALHTFPWQSAAARAGLKRDAVYLVRPDGYVGLADPKADPGAVVRYLDARDLRPLRSPSAELDAPRPGSRR